MKTFINGIQLKGFKSFNRPTVIEFGPGLNCIVGPNGSGKSNILDAICFVLGRLSTKSIRAENYADLLHKQKDQAVTDGEVIFNLDNSSNIFPVQSDKVEVRRRIAKDGNTLYYINKKHATRRQVVELLSMSKVFPEGHNIILQGDINNFINLSSIDKRRLVEEIAGIHIYEAKKEDALRELQKVEEKLREASIVLTEKKANLNSLEAEKKVAEKYRSYNNEMEAARATEFYLRMDKIKEKRGEIGQKFGKIEDAHNRIKEQITDSEKKIEILQSKIDEIEKHIEKKGGENQLDLQKQIENLKVEVESGKQLISGSKKEIERILLRSRNLKERFDDLAKSISEKEKEKKELEREHQILGKRLSSLESASGISDKNIAEIEKQLEQRESALNELKESKLKMQEKQQKISSDLQVIDYKLKDLGTRLDEAEAQKSKFKELGKDKDSYKDLIQEINKFTSQDSKFVIELSELRRRVSEREDIVAKLRVDATSTQELLMNDKAVSTILKAGKEIQGIVGTVAELGNVKTTYSKALGIAAGFKLKNIVVKDENTAIKCITLLKQSKLGVATFLPLNKIRAPSISDEVKAKLSAEGVIGLASELVTCKPEHKIVFEHIFKDTLIVEDSNVAKRLGIGHLNLVTVDGDIFSRTGAITGGFRREGGIKFSDKDSLAKLEYELGELSKLKKELKEKEAERSKFEEKIIALRGEKAELEGKISSTDDKKLDAGAIEKEINDLRANKKGLDEELKKLDKEFGQIDEKISKATVDRNASSIKVKEFKFGKKSSEVKEIESKLSQFDSKISALSATIENVLLPEKGNIMKVISSLDKEKSEFEEQIKSSDKEIKEKQKLYADKEKEERKYYGELKTLFAEKGKYQEVMKQEDDTIKALRQKITEDEEERNSLSIAKAKIDAEFEALQTEILPLKDVKPLPYLASPLAAKKKQEELLQKVQELGSVNMRALEIYETVKQEFDNLSWRVDKLASEKDSVINVINEVEHKKYDSFMQTFKKLDEHFQGLFNRISDNKKGAIVLENPEKPFEAGVRINIHDQHGKQIYLAALSGGEKTLVAIAFLLAVQEFNPAPFYLLDEIDAALDKVNSEKVAKLLEEYSKKAQVIIISHNDAVISLANNLYGIWMNKQGESYINALKI